MAVSGELRYLGPDFSSVERVRPVKAMMRPESLAMGKMMRLRNLEYIASAAAGFWLLASAPLRALGSGRLIPGSGKRSEESVFADDRRLMTHDCLPPSMRTGRFRVRVPRRSRGARRHAGGSRSRGRIRS